MIATQSKSIAYSRQNISTLLIVLLSVVLLLAVSMDGTVITTVLLRQYAWRATLVLLVVLSGLIWLNVPMKVSARVWNRVLVFFTILGGVYIALVFAEAINSMSSGSAPLLVRTTFFRMFTIVPAMVTIFVASGGGMDVKKGLRALLTPYVYLSLAISVFGILAWALVQFEIVNWQDWLVPQELNGKLARKGGANLYSLPYYLGLILVGASDIDFLGTFRISGWSPEPHTAALFVTPALFMIPFIFRGRKWLSITACSSVILFDFLAFSVTNIFALLAIGALILVRFMIVGGRLRKIHHTTLFASLAGLILLMFGGLILQSGHVEFIRYKSLDSISADAVEGVHHTIADTNSLLGKGIFRDPDNELGEDLEVGLISSATFWAQAVILAAAGCLLFLSRKPTFPIGLSLLYVIIHSMKDPSHILWWPIYIFMITIAVLALSATSGKSHVAENDRAEPKQA